MRSTVTVATRQPKRWSAFMLSTERIRHVACPAAVRSVSPLCVPATDDCLVVGGPRDQLTRHMIPRRGGAAVATRSQRTLRTMRPTRPAWTGMTRFEYNCSSIRVAELKPPGAGAEIYFQLRLIGPESGSVPCFGSFLGIKPVVFQINFNCF